MKASIKWFAGFFEDQGGNASSKRAVAYIFCFFAYLLVKAGVNSKSAIDINLFFFVGAVILVCIGAISSETITKMITEKEKNTSETVKVEKTETSSSSAAV